MEASLFQLRSFVHRRLYAAAEEILGEVEKTITCALYEAEVRRSREEVESLRQQLGALRNKSAAESSLTSRPVELQVECSTPDIPGPSRPAESHFSLSGEVPEHFQTNADPDSGNRSSILVQTDFRTLKIKEEHKELGNDSNTDWAVLSEGVTNNEDQMETQRIYEMQPVSPNCSGTESDNGESNEESLNSKGEQSEQTRQKATILQGLSDNIYMKGQSASPFENSSANKSRILCHLCGKRFRYIGFLKNHIQKHENNQCTICRKTFKSSPGLVAHLKVFHSKAKFCDICGKTYISINHLRVHEKRHGMDEFVCEECGKTFNTRDNLILHVRTHFGEII